MMTPQDQLELVEQAAELLAAARYLVALVGAGMSVESGIPPFRGAGGLWTKYGEPPMNGFQQFLEDPKLWWERRLARDGARPELQEAIERAEPNAGHYALASLEEQGTLKAIITQNIDDLHRRAGSKNILEIHGNRYRLRCLQCHARFDESEFTITEIPPRCPHCSGLVKSDTVMFGEPIPPLVLGWCRKEALRCDCMLVLGTSAVVYPAAEFPLVAKSSGASLIEINPDETALSCACDVALRAPTGEALPLLVSRTKELMNAAEPG